LPVVCAMTTRAPTHIGKEHGFVLIDLINAIPFTLAANPLNALTIGTLINIVAIIADAFSTVQPRIERRRRICCMFH
jgi:hypothetical protein